MTQKSSPGAGLVIAWLCQLLVPGPALTYALMRFFSPPRPGAKAWALLVVSAAWAAGVVSVVACGRGRAWLRARRLHLSAGAAALAVSLASAELGAHFLVNGPAVEQIIAEDRQYAATRVDPRWGWTFRPNVDVEWTSNRAERQSYRIRVKTVPVPGCPECGMRDDGLDAGAREVIPVFGDSYTFGSTVEREDIWSERIEARNPGIDMLDLASGGGLTKAVAQYAVLRDSLPAHRVVLYAMWLGNEFLDNAQFPELQRTADAQIAESERNALRVHVLALSRLLFLADAGWTSLLRAMDPSDARASLYYGPEPTGFWDETYGNLYVKTVNPVLTRYAEPEYPAQVALGVANTERAIREMKALAGPRRVIVIIMPFKEQVYSDIIDRLRPGLVWDRPNVLVQQMCERCAVECWDTTDAIRARKAQRLYWDYDPHFTARGQLYASNEIERLMTQAHLLP